MSPLLPLGAIVGTRSGDKGGDANVGIWVPDPVELPALRIAQGQATSLKMEGTATELADARYAWLCSFLTVERMRELLPEVGDLRIERHVLANLRALNFVIHGLLGRGVAESTRSDPQAKGLGEHLRSRLVPIPDELQPSHDTTRTP